MFVVKDQATQVPLKVPDNFTTRQLAAEKNVSIMFVLTWNENRHMA